jgi:fimbrial chaperone protein
MHFFFFLMAVTAHAFRLEPMVLSLPVTGPRTSGTYSVENNSGEKIAVQFELRKRTSDREGKEERPPAEGFLIYPQQMALEPGEKRSVRVSWTSDQAPSQELPFRLVATQLPVSFDKAKSTGASLRFLLEYVASLYLVPPGAKAKMKIVSSQINAQNEFEVVVKNEGTAHQLLDHLNLGAEGSGKKAEASGAVLDELRTGNVLAGEERALRFPLPKGFPKNAKAKVQFGP